MIQGILASAHIEGITVGEEYLSALFLNQVDDNFGIIRAKIGQVAGFTKMNFDRGILVFKIDLLQHPRFLYKTGQFLKKIFSKCCPEVSKIYF